MIFPKWRWNEHLGGCKALSRLVGCQHVQFEYDEQQNVAYFQLLYFIMKNLYSLFLYMLDEK
jgi:hypothetical protein